MNTKERLKERGAWAAASYYLGFNADMSFRLDAKSSFGLAFNETINVLVLRLLEREKKL